MDVSGLGWLLLIGALGGGLAGSLMRDGGLGLIINIIVGVIGSLIGNWLFILTGYVDSGGLVSPAGAAFVGAAALVIFISLIRRA